ncbi:MAG: SGNH/GDSL hydrolase family protein [Lachnospiraceae bacterium]|nr:SGNH/GDSL hydrolase family protein [Lachnospiraceae bacterium]
MKAVHGGKTILYWAAAFVIFLMIGAVLFRNYFILPKTQKNIDYRIVVFGDSIIGEYREETSVTAIMSSALSEPVFNAALGGTCMSYTETDKRLAYTKDCLNMAGLSQAVYADDFSVQLNARIRESATDYFDETIKGLSAIDFTCVDIVFIGQGLNDYHGAVSLDNEDAPYDTHTFAGALRSSVENLRAVNPDVRIILVTPTFSWYRDEQLTCEEYNPGGGLLCEYVEKEYGLAEELGIEIVDIYHDFYSHDNWEDWELYTNDGLHPNELGRRMIADALCRAIE